MPEKAQPVRRNDLLRLCEYCNYVLTEQCRSWFHLKCVAPGKRLKDFKEQKHFFCTDCSHMQHYEALEEPPTKRRKVAQADEEIMNENRDLFY